MAKSTDSAIVDPSLQRQRRLSSTERLGRFTSRLLDVARPRSNSFLANLANEHLEIAARERTFDGAYMRTALSAIASGIFIYRIFSKAFAPIALAYVIFGTIVLLLSSFRRWRIMYVMWERRKQGVQQRAEENVTICSPSPVVPLSDQVGADASKDLSVDTDVDEAPIELQPIASPWTADSSSDLRRRQGAERKSVSIVLPGEIIEYPSQVQLEHPMEGIVPASPLEDPIAELTFAEEMQQQRRQKLQVIRLNSGQSATVPAAAPMQKLGEDYIAWRQQLENPPSAPVFETSGGTVLLFSILTAAAELVVMVFLLYI